QIEVDISQITDFTTVIHVRDLNLGDKVQVLTAEDDNVVTVTPSRMDVEEAAITEQEQLGEPELAGDDATTAETDDDQTAS
ncbi:MAG: hypothetical protein M3R24_15145, partial [Chloroflexota bacterium]|nr:hypothetical protein [Chloroflexota bacterium]